MLRKIAVLCAAIVTLSLAGCGYNDLQRQDEGIKAAWSEVLNQYQRRADLIPNLVATVKGYAAQEERVLVEVTEARAKVGSIQVTPEVLNDPKAFEQFQAAQAQLTGALSRLIAVAENYPDLKASANFQQLQGELSDTEDRLALGNARRCGSLQELLETAEAVSLHVDGRPGNRDLFGEDEFAAMRPRSLFLNMSRGFVVDHASLRKHIESGHIAGAAIDVFPTEPKRQGDPFESELRGLANVILTPHVGGSTEEAQKDIGRFVAGKLRGYADGGSTSLSVNLPTISTGELAGSHRLAHVHRNVPGVLAKVNAMFAEYGVNVDSQSLSTRGEVGYLVTDVNSNYTPTILERLEQLPETIRLRVLS